MNKLVLTLLKRFDLEELTTAENEDRGVYRIAAQMPDDVSYTIRELQDALEWIANSVTPIDQ